MTEQRRLAAIMFADVCGYSHIMGADESQALSILEMAGDCIDQAATMYDGRIIKKMGDGFLVEFTSAVNAVQGALSVQKAVAEHNAAAALNEQFQLRIGLHVGDVVVDDDDILGDGVNVASRIEPLAEPGGICISRDVFDLVQNKIPLEVVNLGPKALKNISRKIDLYKVQVDAVAGGVGRPVAPTCRRGGLRAGVISFCIVILLALVALGVKQHLFKVFAGKAFRDVEIRAKAKLDENLPSEALAILESYPAKFGETEWQMRIDEMLSVIKDEVVRKDVSSRQEAFLKAIASNNRAVALALVHPDTLRRGDVNMLWNRLTLMAGLLKLTGTTSDSFRVRSITLSEERKKATLYMDFLKKNGEKEKTQPSEWRLVDGKWYVYGDPAMLKPVRRRRPDRR